MASDDSKARNQAFLQQLEKQRLQKPCQRVIDLRGRVPGDCYAYEFAGRVHYLDDRAYLILKQLLDRTQGKYTIGVYEALQAALKKLGHPQTADQFTSEQLVLQRDPARPQLLRFDKTVQRREPRIRFVTPLSLSLRDVEYRAATVDLTTSSLRISLKRAFTLEAGDEVLVTFTSLLSEAPEGLLADVPYRISRIDHDAQHSYAILTRQREANDLFSSWWDDRIQQLLHPGALDLQSELFNLSREFYLRIYTRMLPSPLLWIGSADHGAVVHILHHGKATEALLSAMQSPMTLPLQDMLTDKMDRLLLTGDAQTAVHCRLDDPAAVKTLFNMHQQQSRQKLLWLQISPVDVDISQHQHELNQLAGIDFEASEQLQAQLSSTTAMLRIIDLSNASQHLSDGLDEPQTCTEVTEHVPLPPPQVIRHEIRRQHQRYVVRTPVEVRFNDQNYSFQSTDLSATGIALQAEGRLDIPEQSRVYLHFPRWQAKSSNLKLDDIPYTVKAHHYWNGQTHIGLERISSQCRPGINGFFDSVLQSNADNLLLHHDDVIVSQQSRIFSHILSRYMQPILLFFGMSEDQQRIIQAVAISEHNEARSDEQLWAALTSHVAMMTSTLKPQLSTCKEQLDFGIYAFQMQTSSDWQIRLEQQFETPAEKQRFLSRALASNNQRFFQCKIMPFKAAGLEQEADLQQQLVRLRHHSSHKVKNIRETFSSLFAVAELHDITDILKAC